MADNLLEIVGNDPNFSLLVDIVILLDTELEEDVRTALGGATFLEALADPDSDLTVFAPTNDAFIQAANVLDPDTIGSDVEEISDWYSALPEDTLSVLLDIVLYHISDGAKSPADIQNMPDLTMLNGEILSASTFEVTSFELVDLDLSAPNAFAALPAVEATNGIAYVIDSLVLPFDLLGDDEPDPLPTIFETVEAVSGEVGDGFDENGEDFDFLREALVATGLDELANDPEADLTVFGPNDEAFVTLAQTLNYDGSDEEGAFDYLLDALNLLNIGNGAIPLLDTVLKYHVSLGAKTVAEIKDAGTVDVIGGTLTVNGSSLEDADPDIDDPTLLEPDGVDILASNGIIQSIDGVLLPADILVSDGSDDVDFIIGSNRQDFFNTGFDNDWIDAKGGRDIIISGQGDDVVLAGGGRDFVNAGKGDDTVKGEGGADKIIAGHGDDYVDGGSGNDWIFGGKGDDTIAGGEGNDWLLGGLGKDTFVFEENGGHDTIQFFWIGHDKIDLTAFEFDSVDDFEINRKGKVKSEIDLGDDTTISVKHLPWGLDADDFIL